ncbi:MAG: UDP-N-acetylmuramate--L-alanine ligase [Candidatus Anoxychlamydiales bacterium]|nr:UDP-N-acetylmuramate--L-alanine ligase [Candidatus Anoxychlamydiales bacterium]
MKDFYHFIGIGGIGMSALASLLLEKKNKVKGSDIKSNAIIKELEKKGAKIAIGHKKEIINENDIVIVSTAIDKKNQEYERAKKLNLQILHRSDLLDRLMRGSDNILITGTHGKTTTSALLTEVFFTSNLDPSFVLGGILNSKNSNAHLGKDKYFIAEADESDGSFINVKNKIFAAIVTNLEKEHLNYWKTFENLKNAFKKFFKIAKNSNLIFWCYDDANLRSLNVKNAVSYGFSKKANLRASNVRIKDFQTTFDIKFFDKTFKNIKINLLGSHNVLNALAVFGLATQLNIDEMAIRKAFESFLGVKRRLEKIGEHQKATFFDDYAHHPTEIKTTLQSLRKSIKERRLLCIFQPHRYSRVKDLFNDFINSFGAVDELIITDIYSASEKPIKNINEQILVDEIRKKGINEHLNVSHIKDKDLKNYLLKNVIPFDVVIAMGAGDISKKIRDIYKAYTKKIKKFTVGIIYGGKSNEHSISIRSTKNYIKGFDRSLYDLKYFKILENGKWIFQKDIDENINVKKSSKIIDNKILSELLTCDICFHILHGPLGEDGMIGAFLQTLDIPYVGCDYYTSAIAMDKAFSKTIAKKNGVDTLDFIELNHIDYRENREKILKKINKKFKDLDLIVKPNHLGSSLGIEVVTDINQLSFALDRAFKVDTSLIIEEKINAREIQTAVFGNDYIEIGELSEMLTNGEFYDFENKYEKKEIVAKIPIDLSDEKKAEIKELSQKVYLALKLNGFARIDFFIDKNEKIYFFEVNPIPGFSSNNSTFAKMLEFIGYDNKKMIDQFIILAMHKKRKNKILEK